MQINDNDLKHPVILEEIHDQNKAIMEMLSSFSGVPERVERIETIVERIDADNKAAKLAIKDQTRQLDSHETRITQLETV